MRLDLLLLAALGRLLHLRRSLYHLAAAVAVDRSVGRTECRRIRCLQLRRLLGKGWGLGVRD